MIVLDVLGTRCPVGTASVNCAALESAAIDTPVIVGGLGGDAFGGADATVAVLNGSASMTE